MDSKTSIAPQRAGGWPAHQWQKQHEASPDDLIDAYLKGKEDGRNEHEAIFMEKLRSNSDRALGEASIFYQSARDEFDVDLKGMWARIHSVTQFDILCLVRTEDFVSTEMLQLIGFAREYCKSKSGNTFKISINFAPMTEHTSREAIMADGYHVDYDDKQ